MKVVGVIVLFVLFSCCNAALSDATGPLYTAALPFLSLRIGRNQMITLVNSLSATYTALLVGVYTN